MGAPKAMTAIANGWIATAKPWTRLHQSLRAVSWSDGVALGSMITTRARPRLQMSVPRGLHASPSHRTMLSSRPINRASTGRPESVPLASHGDDDLRMRRVVLELDSQALRERPEVVALVGILRSPDALEEGAMVDASRRRCAPARRAAATRSVRGAPPRRRGSPNARRGRRGRRPASTMPPAPSGGLGPGAGPRAPGQATRRRRRAWPGSRPHRDRARAPCPFPHRAH